MIGQRFGHVNCGGGGYRQIVKLFVYVQNGGIEEHGRHVHERLLGKGKKNNNFYLRSERVLGIFSKFCKIQIFHLNFNELKIYDFRLLPDIRLRGMGFLQSSLPSVFNIQIRQFRAYRRD